MAARRTTTALALLILTGCATAIAPPPRAAPDPGTLSALERFGRHPCTGRVAEVLAGLGVPGSAVTGVTYDERRYLNRERPWGYDVWVQRAGEPGALVVSVDDICVPQQVYARGGASLPGGRG
ncbi:hypothetical protein HL658_16005 [Azospirillum sp. RWY-5-1]|uniref:Lipoprotein SmpA/OmlA domain-containing protein n=1 Tax=Azospirillum oleiclasticum TaxID=2735135 RepID=A0ABX2TEH4_9PROT|nr:hypothetical protein [Azospirillum oleiclasticum]NYZ14059.1 hypothetical protein [Azospirillum oleiclasticum]NYZ21543.1 hypothetical protein [Azospirillum oleiclasticum]